MRKVHKNARKSMKSFDMSKKSSTFAPSISTIVFWLAFCRQPYFSIIDFFWYPARRGGGFCVPCDVLCYLHEIVIAVRHFANTMHFYAL